MLFSNTDINVYINKYIYVYDILLLRKSYKNIIISKFINITN